MNQRPVLEREIIAKSLEAENQTLKHQLKACSNIIQGRSGTMPQRAALLRIIHDEYAACEAQSKQVNKILGLVASKNGISI